MTPETRRDTLLMEPDGRVVKGRVVIRMGFRMYGRVVVCIGRVVVVGASLVVVVAAGIVVVVVVAAFVAVV
jgi:hypothetical protein